jgi:hypothetical protein
MAAPAKQSLEENNGDAQKALKFRNLVDGVSMQLQMVMVTEKQLDERIEKMARIVFLLKRGEPLSQDLDDLRSGGTLENVTDMLIALMAARANGVGY